MASLQVGVAGTAVSACEEEGLPLRSSAKRRGRRGPKVRVEGIVGLDNDGGTEAWDGVRVKRGLSRKDRKKGGEEEVCMAEGKRERESETNP